MREEKGTKHSCAVLGLFTDLCCLSKVEQVEQREGVNHPPACTASCEMGVKETTTTEENKKKLRNREAKR